MIAIPEDSIDYAVMEKSDIVKVVPSNISWSDVGSFDSLFEDEKYIAIDSKNNFVYGKDKVIATIDLIIVDALLKVVERLKETKSELHNIHLTGYRHIQF